MAQITPVDPFDHSRLYGEEKYGLNDMELASANMPATVDDDKVTSVWSDRLSEQWRKASEGIKSRDCADAFWAGVSDADLLAFASRVAADIAFKHEVTGARVVRFTDAGGYPTLRLDITSGGNGRCAYKQRHSSRGGRLNRHDARSFGKYGDEWLIL